MNSHRVARSCMTFVPTLTSATLVPSSFPDTLSRSYQVGCLPGPQGDSLLEHTHSEALSRCRGGGPMTLFETCRWLVQWPVLGIFCLGLPTRRLPDGGVDTSVVGPRECHTGLSRRLDPSIEHPGSRQDALI